MTVKTIFKRAYLHVRGVGTITILSYSIVCLCVTLFMFVWQANVEFIGSAVAQLTATELLQLKVSVKEELVRTMKVDSFSCQSKHL